MANINRVVLVGQPDQGSRAAAHAERHRGLQAAHRGQHAPEGRRTGEWTDKPNYFDVTVWGNQGESCAQYLVQGPPGRRSTAASTGASGTPRTARSARRSRSSPTPSSSSAAARRGRRRRAPVRAGRTRAADADFAPAWRRRRHPVLRHEHSRTTSEDASRRTARRERRRKRGRADRSARNCYFCKEKVDEVDYKNANQLRRYISEKGKIRSRRITGACRRHQRQLAVAIKRAREMALLPYVSAPAMEVILSPGRRQARAARRRRRRRARLCTQLPAAAPLAETRRRRA